MALGGNAPLGRQCELCQLGVGAMWIDAGLVRFCGFSIVVGAQHEQAAVRGSKRVQSAQFQGAVDLVELLTHKFGVHRAHHGAFFFQQLLIDAGPHAHGQLIGVDGGVHAGIFEVFVEHIQLVECVVVEVLPVVQFRTDATQQLASSTGFDRAISRSLAMLGVLNGKVLHRWATPPAGVDWRAMQQSFVFEHAEMIAGGVDV